MKRKLKITGYLIWETVLYLTTKYNISLQLIKVKSHDGNWANDYADNLAKKGLFEPRLQITDNLIENKAILQWYNRTVEWRPRKFVKTLHEIKNTITETKLHRSKKLVDVNKKIS